MTVTPATVAVALGRATPEQESTEFAQWSMWISDALMLIGDRLGDVTELDQAKLDYVVREAVAAQVRRPDDATSVDVAVDDGRVSKTYRTSAGRVSIRDEWWELLSPAAKSGAFTVDTFPKSGVGIHAPWCDLMFLGADCSCGASLAGWPMYEPLP